MLSFNGSARAVSAALHEGTYVLREAGSASARVEAKELLEYVLDTPLYAAPSAMNGGQWEHYLTLVGARAAGTPLQHLTGRMYFRRLRLHAKPGVFIVRPETEVLVDAALQFARADLGNCCMKESRGYCSDAYRVVDLCSGSGAIALSVGSELTGYEIPVQVAGVEISDAALELAAMNRADCIPEVSEITTKLAGSGNQVSFLKGDATKGLPSEIKKWAGKVHLLVTNPPYVKYGNVRQTEALTDPPAALYGGGADGADIGKAILVSAREYLASGAGIFMEHDENQHQVFARFAEKLGYVGIEEGRDLSGRSRYTKFVYPGREPGGNVK